MNINRKGPQTDIPQNVGSKEGLSAKIYQLDTLNISKCILKFEIPSQKFSLHWKWHCQRFVARTKKVAKNEMSQGYYTG